MKVRRGGLAKRVGSKGTRFASAAVAAVASRTRPRPRPRPRAVGSTTITPIVQSKHPLWTMDPTQGPPESLVLDIGDDIGAPVLYADESCLGMEIDLTPLGAPRSHHGHTMIRRRRAVEREFIAGVYPELVEGVYTVWGSTGSRRGT